MSSLVAASNIYYITPNMTITEIASAIKSYRHIVFSPGVYEITKQLIIKDNTYIEGYGATLVRAGVIQSIFLNECNKNTTGYTGAGNITIRGLTFKGVAITSGNSGDNLVTFFHSHDINISDVTFIDAQQNHAIEFNACKNVKMHDFVISGYNNKDTYREAVQIDFAAYSEFVIKGTVAADNCYDGTCCCGIHISNGIFRDSEKYEAPVVGIGAHSQPYGGAQHDGIVIENCYMHGTAKSQAFVSLAAMKNVIISSCVVKNCRRGIKFNASSYSYKNDGTKDIAMGDGSCNNVLISDNYIGDMQPVFVCGGIFLVGEAALEQIHSDIKIINNLFESVGNKTTTQAIFVSDADKVTIVRNMFNRNKEGFVDKFKVHASNGTNVYCDGNNGRVTIQLQ